LFHTCRADPNHANHFISAAVAGGYSNGRTRHFQKMGEESNAGFIGFAIDWRRSDLQLQSGTKHACNLLEASSWMDFHGKCDGIALRLNRDHFFRSPKMAVPTRTQVEPSSMATSKSCDIPIESKPIEISGRRRAAMVSRSSRSRRK